MVFRMDDNTNFLVPKHRKLSSDEVSAVLVKYSLEGTSKLPKIKKGDSALASLEAQAGDVIEITRKSFAGVSKYYRVVIE